MNLHRIRIGRKINDFAREKVFFQMSKRFVACFVLFGRPVDPFDALATLAEAIAQFCGTAALGKEDATVLRLAAIHRERDDHFGAVPGGGSQQQTERCGQHVKLPDEYGCVARQAADGQTLHQFQLLCGFIRKALGNQLLIGCPQQRQIVLLGAESAGGQGSRMGLQRFRGQAGTLKIAQQRRKLFRQTGRLNDAAIIKQLLLTEGKRL